jgi:hypothetical protein
MKALHKSITAICPATALTLGVLGQPNDSSGGGVTVVGDGEGWRR